MLGPSRVLAFAVVLAIALLALAGLLGPAGPGAPGGGLWALLRSVDGGVRRDVFLYADATLLQFLLEVLTKEWLERLQGHAGSRLALRVTEEEGGFVRFTLQTQRRRPP